MFVVQLNIIPHYQEFTSHKPTKGRRKRLKLAHKREIKPSFQSPNRNLLATVQQNKYSTFSFIFPKQENEDQNEEETTTTKSKGQMK